MTDKSSQIGRFLKAVREKKKLTLYAVAKLADVSISQVKSVEDSNAAYTADTLAKITHALGVEVIFKFEELSEKIN